LENKVSDHEDLFSGNHVVQCRQTDEQTQRHDKVHSHFSQFANVPKV